MDGQGELRTIDRRKAATLTFLTVALIWAACAPLAQAAPRQTPSGQPVPRYVSLKFDKVYARAGPGEDHRLLWVYEAKGLPVQVIAETREWRKICDPEGAVAWVHRTVVSSRRGAFNPTAAEVPVRSGRSDTSALRARLLPRSIIALEACEDGWCRVRARKLRGWVSERAVFGTAQRPLCNAARPAGTGRP